MKFVPMLAGATLALALSVSAQAQTLTGANTEDILAIAKNYGSASMTKQSNGDPQITGKIGGVSYQVYFRNCTDNKNCEDLNFYLGFLDIKPTLEEINDWNFNKRFSRAYLDQDKDACVEMDLDMVQGVSAEYVDSQFALWKMVVQQFADHVGFES